MCGQIPRYKHQRDWEKSSPDLTWQSMCWVATAETFPISFKRFSLCFNHKYISSGLEQLHTVSLSSNYLLAGCFLLCFQLQSSVFNETSSSPVSEWQISPRSISALCWGRRLEHSICTALWSLARADLLARVIQTRASIHKRSNDIDCALTQDREYESSLPG